MRHILVTSALALGTAFAQPLSAQDAALILGNERYRELDRVARGAEVIRAEDTFARSGFDVTALANGEAAPTTDAISSFLDVVPDAERVVVALSGRFVTDGDRTWFLTADADDPTLFSLGATAISVESVMEVMGQAAGQAVLLLGADGDDDTLDPWLREGIGDLDVPQGVTVLRGEPRHVADFMTTELAQPRGDLAVLVADNRRIAAEGYVPRSLVFMPARPAQQQQEASPRPQALQAAAEDALWEGAVALDSVEAYRNYLRRYPSGRHSAEAEAAIAEIEREPDRDARLAEESLDLNREQRRNIQRNLSLLDYNTRGIDGIFGPGTRRAIANWQQQNGFPQTTYLSAEQINRIDAQAARRSAELEAEAERRRQQEAQLDRTYWDETGARGDEPGYRAYLERYPDGIFAEEATAGLQEIEAAKRRAAQAEDRNAWDQARQADQPDRYRQYLQNYPQGAFRAEAQARLESLTQQGTEAEAAEQARAEEAALGLNPVTARLVESRLDQLGLEPGQVDGLFDENSRRAIRRYQRDRNLPVSGYLNEPTVVRLLADSIGSILR